MLWRIDQPRWHSPIALCLPTKATEPPSGPLWLHEIKHDGFRIIAGKDDHRVRLYSRPGNDLTRRFPLIVEAVSRLRARSIILDGEAVACGDNGIPNFDRLRYCHHDDSVLLCAFDLIEPRDSHLWSFYHVRSWVHFAIGPRTRPKGQCQFVFVLLVCTVAKSWRPIAEARASR